MKAWKRQVHYAAVCLLAAIASCHRSPVQGIRRLAILPGNILVNEQAQGWWQLAVPIILRQDLATAPQMIILAVQNGGSAYRSTATDTVTVTVDSYGRGYEVETEVRGLKVQQAAEVVDSGPVPGILSALDAAAHQIDAHAVAFPSRNLNALRPYVESFSAYEVTSRISLLRQATSEDPRFGSAYVELIGLAAQTHAPGLSSFLTEGKRSRAAFSSLDGARFDLLASQIEHAAPALQARAAQTVLAQAPSNVEALAALGSAKFRNGDPAGGELLLRKAIDVSAGNNLLILQLAEDQLAAGKFGKAASTYAQLGAAPGFVLDRAASLLLGGEAVHASHLIDEGLDGEGPAAPFHKAQWFAATGDFAAAATLLENTQWASSDEQALASAQASVWRMRLGQRNAAKDDSAAGQRNATGPLAKQFSSVSSLLTAEGSAAQFEARVNTTASGPSRTLLLAYGLFLLQDYKGAAKEWNKIRIQDEEDLPARAMLASCLDHDEQKSAAAAMHVKPFPPTLTGKDPFGAIAFVEMRRLLHL